MNGLEADYNILLRLFLLYQTRPKISVAYPVKVGWNIFFLFRQVKTSSLNVTGKFNINSAFVLVLMFKCGFRNNSR